jgi:hypothetical protein
VYLNSEPTASACLQPVPHRDTQAFHKLGFLCLLSLRKLTFQLKNGPSDSFPRLAMLFLDWLRKEDYNSVASSGLSTDFG